VNKVHTIFVCGNQYANAEDWKYNNDALKNLQDSCDQLVYEAHCYFDMDNTGQYLDGSGGTAKAYRYNVMNQRVGVAKIKPFIKWLKKIIRRDL